MVVATNINSSSSRMSLKEIKRTAAVAWSPPLHTSPLLATGTLAGALDASFNTSAELEIHDLHLEDKSPGSTVRTSITSPSRYILIIIDDYIDYNGIMCRFNRLAWSSHGSSTDGIIIGGCEDGSVSFWNASELLRAPKK